MDYIRKVDDYLRGGQFRYTERPPRTPVDDAPLDYFINVSHLGYCQHFAGAMALMLRMAGIPARVATGFTPGGYSTRHKAWIVRDTDAHAWVEVWFDEYGWVAIDPTPPATPARSQVASARRRPRQRPGHPRPRHRPAGRRRRRPEPDLRPPRAPARPRRRPVRPVTEPAAGAGCCGSLAFVVVVALVLAVVLFIRRPRGKTPMDRAISEVEDAMRRVGRPVTTGTTLTQLERRLGSHSPEVAAYLRALASGRYAPVPDPPPRSGRRALRRALAQGLGFGGSCARCGRCRRATSAASASRARATFEVETTVRG